MLLTTANARRIHSEARGEHTRQGSGEHCAERDGRLKDFKAFRAVMRLVHSLNRTILCGGGYSTPPHSEHADHTAVRKAQATRLLVLRAIMMLRVISAAARRRTSPRSAPRRAARRSPPGRQGRATPA